MGMHPHVRVLGGQRARTAQLGLAAGGRKARRDGVAQAVDAVQRWIRVSVSIRPCSVSSRTPSGLWRS